MRRAETSGDRAARIWAEDPDSGKRRDMTGEEDRWFWTWAAVETLRHTGIRIEELTKLSHHSFFQCTLPSTGETVPLFQIAPSKTDSERPLVISHELADVLAAIISRIRSGKPLPSPLIHARLRERSSFCRARSSCGIGHGAAHGPHRAGSSMAHCAISG